MTIKSNTGCWKLGALFAVAVALPGCVLQEKDDASRFREAIPEAERVKVSGPEDAQAQGSNGAKSSAQTHDETWDDGPWAKWYGFTRAVRQGVNVVTGAVLGGVWLIVHTEPTSVATNEAIWGPWTDSLEPATYRFRVTEVAPDEYEYKLEGRPKASSSDGDWRSVLTGKGWGKGHERHGDGYFTIDLDAARALDPFNHDKDTGTVKITHDLPPNITDNIFAHPRSITAEVKPSATDAWYTVTSNAAADGTGTLSVNAFADADESDLTKKEDIQILSQWNAQGAGRADINISGGDVPVEMGTVKAVECWGTDFYRVYYSDSVNYEPAEGEASACAFSTAPTP